MIRVITLLAFISLGSCSVSEDMIANKELYCSGVYKGIRAVGRVTTEIVEEDAEKK